MSNLSKDHTSVRVHAPPGGHSSNIFGTSEFEQSAANKKKHMESDIFGTKKDNTEPAPTAKQNRNTGNNVFGTDAEETNTKPTTLAGQYKQTQMKSNIFGTDEPISTRPVSDKNKSNIFGTDEPTSTRPVSDKNKSNIFGIGDNNEQNKRQIGGRQGVRDPNASRMGYNPINGESYSTKDNVNSKQQDSNVKKPEEENTNVQTPATNSAENGHAQAAPTNSAENDNAQAANATEHSNVQKPVEKPDNTTSGNNAQKNVHTSVRVVHPPGGKSNGPLW